MRKNMAPCDAESYLQDLDTWDENQAREMARREGIELSEAHMDVICQLRDQYDNAARHPTREAC